MKAIAILSLLLAGSMASAAHADEIINVGDFELATIVPPGLGPGTIGFVVSNNSGPFSLPSDFPIASDLVLQNAVLTYVIGGASSFFSLGDIGPGGYFPTPDQQFPDITLFDSATLTANIVPSQFTLSDNTTWDALSPQISAVLLPSSGPTLIQDLDLALVTVDANQVGAEAPEPSFALVTLAFLTALFLFQHRRVTRDC